MLFDVYLGKSTVNGRGSEEITDIESANKNILFCLFAFASCAIVLLILIVLLLMLYSARQ